MELVQSVYWCNWTEYVNGAEKVPHPMYTVVQGRGLVNKAKGRGPASGVECQSWTNDVDGEREGLSFQFSGVAGTRLMRRAPEPSVQ